MHAEWHSLETATGQPMICSVPPSYSRKGWGATEIIENVDNFSLLKSLQTLSRSSTAGKQLPLIANFNNYQTTGKRPFK